MSRTNQRSVAGILCALLTCTACSTSWIAEAEQIVGALIPAIANVISLVTAVEKSDVASAEVPQVQKAGAQAEADLELLRSLIAEYQEADAAEQANVLGQIQSELTGVQLNLKELLPAVHIEDAATQAKVTALVGVVLSEVQAMAAILPAGNAEKDGAAGMVTIFGARNNDMKPLKAQEFASSYNAIMKARSGNVELDHVAAGLEIHPRRRVARWASAGWLR